MVRFSKKVSFGILLCLLFLLIPSTHVYSKSEPVTFDFKNTDIRDVLRVLSHHSGINFVADPEVSGRVTAYLNESSLEEGLHQLLTSYGWFLDTNNGMYRVRQGIRNERLRMDVNRGLLQIEARGITLEELILGAATLLGVDVLPLVEMPTQVFANISGLSFEQLLEHVLTGQELQWYYNDGIYFIRHENYSNNTLSEHVLANQFQVRFEGERLWVEAQDVPLSLVLQEIARQSKIDLMVAPNVTDLARVFLYGVELDVAISQIVRIHQLSMERTGGILHVYRTDQHGVESTQNILSIRDGRVHLQAKNMPLSKILEQIAIQAKTTIIFTGIDDPLVNLFLQDYPLYDTLQILAQTAGFGCEESNGNYIFVPGFSSAVNDERFRITARENGLSTITAQEAPIRVVLGNLATAVRKNIVISPEVKDTISLVLHDVSLEEAFESVLEIGKLSSVEIRGGLVEICPRSDRENQRSLPAEIKTLQYTNGLLNLEVHDIQLGELIGVLTERYASLEDFPSIAVAGNLASTSVSGAISRMPILNGLRILLTPYKLAVLESATGFLVAPVEEPERYRVSFDEGKLDIIAREAPINRVLEEIGRKTGVSFLLPPELNFPINYDVTQIFPSEAVQMLLEPYGYSVAPTSQTANDWEGVFRVLPPDTSLVRLGNESGKYTLMADNAELSMIVREIGRVSNRNIVIQPGAYPRVSLELRNLFVEEMLGVLARTYNLDVTNQDSYYSVALRSTPTNTLDAPHQNSYVPGLSFFEISDSGIHTTFSNVVLGDLLDAIAANGGPRFVADASAANRRVSGEIKGTHSTNEISNFLQSEGLYLLPVPDQVFVRDLSFSQPLIYLADDLFYLDIHGGDLTAIIREMANKAGYAIIIYPTVRGTVNSLQIKGVSFEQGLHYLLQGTTFAFRESDGVYVIGEGITPRVDSPGFTESKIIKLSYISPSELLAILPPSIPSQNIRPVPGDYAIVAFGNTTLLSMLEQFIAEVDHPVQTDPVLLPIRHADPTEVTTVLARHFSGDMFHYIQSQNAILLTSSPEKNGEMIKLVQGIDKPELAVVSKLIPLFHIRAEEAKSYLGQDVDTSRILVIPEQNALMVSGNQEQIGKLELYLKEIDVRNPQIVFEIAIVEISGRSNSQLGLSGSTGDGTVKFDLAGQLPLTLTFGKGFLADASVKATLRTLVQDGQAKLLANPTLTTLNGKEASFNVLTTSRYWVPESERGGESNAGKPQDTTAFRTIETGIRLRLKPWMSASGEITIELDPEISDSAGASSASSLPSTNDRSVHTTIRVKDGETIVIGGLIQRSEQKEISKIPLLGDLPLVGRIFSSETSSEVETEFVITITSHVLDFSALTFDQIESD